jgi:hypothetical protein
MTALAAPLRPLLIDDPAACAEAARQLAAGAVVANACASFYVIITRRGCRDRPPGE